MKSWTRDWQWLTSHYTEVKLSAKKTILEHLTADFQVEGV